MDLTILDFSVTEKIGDPLFWETVKDAGYCPEHIW